MLTTRLFNLTTTTTNLSITSSNRSNLSRKGEILYSRQLEWLEIIKITRKAIFHHSMRRSTVLTTIIHLRVMKSLKSAIRNLLRKKWAVWDPNVPQKLTQATQIPPYKIWSTTMIRNLLNQKRRKAPRYKLRIQKSGSKITIKLTELTTASKVCLSKREVHSNMIDNLLVNRRKMHRKRSWRWVTAKWALLPG